MMVDVMTSFSRFALTSLSAVIAIGSLCVQAQESWSDSAPRIMKIVKNNCPLKVRGKSGEWGTFTDKLPAGRHVIGAINPRRPDLVFFQLQRESRFMFMAPRTCFEGEEDWNLRAIDERLGYKKLKNRRSYVSVSGDMLYSDPDLVSITSGVAKIPLKSRTLGSCLGLGFEKRVKEKWFYGGFGCLGLGLTKVRARKVAGSTYDDSDSAFSFYASGRFTAYYDFMTLPYGMGFDAYAGFLRAKNTTSAVNYFVSPTFGFNYGVAAAWRFYWDKVIISPKIVLNKFLPRNTGFELQLAYVFDAE
jgi:hypothetical protein